MMRLLLYGALVLAACTVLGNSVPLQSKQPERPPVTTEPLYHEMLRPQFHFTARYFNSPVLNPQRQQEGWINDLNGLIYYDGEYHLFAQRWAICWLHAVSRDLIHWKELEPAFWEETKGSGVQSGTCVVDYHNTSGLGRDDKHPPMVAFWSRFDNRSQCISYSLDRGRTWKLYEKNPIFVHPERDPKVFWYAPGKHWVMVMYGESQYHILTSHDLLHWTDEHQPIPNSFECPDFFELPLDGVKSKMKWVLIRGNGKYSFGTFDGTKFNEESPQRVGDIGPNFYATQTWANTETGDGRRIQVAWMAESPFPGMPFSQEISFPCELTLRTTPDGVRLFREPIREISKLHKKGLRWTKRVLHSGESLSLSPDEELAHITAEVAIPEGAKLTFNLRGETVVLTSKTVQSGSASATAIGPIHTVEILLDCGSIEVFVNGGEISSTRYVLPQGSGLSVKAEGGDVALKSLALFPMKSIWPQ